jgi:hypothetical protein
LLAGAAVLFVLASAIVAFRGWPQVAAQPATAAVTVSAPAGGTSSRDARRLSAAIGAPASAVAAVARRTVKPGRGHSLRTRTGSTGNLGSGAGSASAGGAPGSTASATGTSGSPVQAVLGSTPPGGCTGAGCNVPAPQNVISNAANTASQTVSNAGSAVGSAVSGVAGSGNGTTPPPAGPVQGTGTTAGNAVTGATTTPSGTLTTVTNALPGQ